MKKLLSLILLLCFCTAMAFGEELSHDYVVKTSKAPVWTYQDVTSIVVGYIDYGIKPGSMVDNDDMQWIYVEQGDLKGWSHIMAFCHTASPLEDLEFANGSFADFLRDKGVSEDVIKKCTTGKPDNLMETDDTGCEYADDRQASSKASSGDVLQAYSARGLEPMYIYVIDKDVECPINDAYAYHGSAIRVTKDSETFSGGTWFATEGEQSDGIVMMSGGNGYDLPASAYHLLTEKEYLAYMEGTLSLSHVYHETPLKYFLESHDVAQARDWKVDFNDYTRKTVGDLYPLLIPILVLVLLYLVGKFAIDRPLLMANLAIADLVVLCFMLWHYISMPSRQFDDWRGFAWVIIVIVALLAMAVILYVAWNMGKSVMNKYEVTPSLKSLAIGLVTGFVAALVMSLIMIYVFGCEKDGMAVSIVNIICVIGCTLGFFAVNIIRQNKAVGVALPSVLVLWIIAIMLAFIFIAIAFFVVFVVFVWKFMHGGKFSVGLLGEQGTCADCRKNGSMSCPHHNDTSKSLCNEFERN